MAKKISELTPQLTSGTITGDEIVPLALAGSPGSNPAATLAVLRQWIVGELSVPVPFSSAGVSTATAVGFASGFAPTAASSAGIAGSLFVGVAGGTQNGVGASASVASSAGIGSYTTAAPLTADYYVATNGNDSTGNGTIGSPFASINRAVQAATAGAGVLIYVRGGTYNITNSSADLHVFLNKSGSANTEAGRFKVWNYPGEKPIFDHSAVTTGAEYWTGRPFRIQASYVHLFGITVRYGYTGGICVTGGANTCIVEACEVHNCGRGAPYEGKGIVVQQANSVEPQNTLILNCDSHHNVNDTAFGYHADGFYLEGIGTQAKGCRAWNNIDDGYDTYRSTGGVLMERCMAWDNARDDSGAILAGDGQGFKNGGPEQSGVTGNTFSHCIAWDNKGHGFDQNSNPLPATITNCTSYNNNAANDWYENYYWAYGPVNGSVIRDCISHGTGARDSARNRETDTYASVKEYDSWNTGGVTATDADFASLSDTTFTGPRNGDGTLNIAATHFMQLAGGSEMNTASSVGGKMGADFSTVPASVAQGSIGTPPPGQDTTPPTCTISLAPGQLTPTGDAVIDFYVTFSEPITNLTNTDFSVTGTATYSTKTVALSGSTSPYLLQVSGMNATGTVIAQLPANRCQDLAGNNNLVSNSVTVNWTTGAGAGQWGIGATVAPNEAFVEVYQDSNQYSTQLGYAELGSGHTGTITGGPVDEGDGDMWLVEWDAPLSITGWSFQFKLNLTS